MNLNDYQQEACRTGATGKDPTLQLAVLGLGITGEAGEVADLIKKTVGHGHPANNDKIVAELGDVLWYVAVLAAHVGASLDEVAERNQAKLRARYPDGFSTERSINRVA